MIIHFNSILSGLGVQHCVVAGPIKKKEQNNNKTAAKQNVMLRLRLTAATGAYVPGLLRQCSAVTAATVNTHRKIMRLALINSIKNRTTEEAARRSF